MSWERMKAQVKVVFLVFQYSRSLLVLVISISVNCSSNLLSSSSLIPQPIHISSKFPVPPNEWQPDQRG